MQLAVTGKSWSGVTVGQMMYCTSAGVRPASSRAARAASAPRSELACSSEAMRRSLIPVWLTIHSSLVSTIFSRSAFVRTRSGTYEPTPVTTAGLRDIQPAPSHTLAHADAGLSGRASPHAVAAERTSRRPQSARDVSGASNGASSCECTAGAMPARESADQLRAHPARHGLIHSAPPVRRRASAGAPPAGPPRPCARSAPRCGSRWRRSSRGRRC